MITLFVMFLLMSGVANAATWHTFYWGGYDPKVTTIEAYLAKWEKPGMARANRTEVLESARRAFGRDFKDWEEYKKFLRSPEVSVAPCVFTKTRISHLELKPRRIGYQIRDHLPDEFCIRYQGSDRISLLCGQDLEPPRVVAVTPAPAVTQIQPPPRPITPSVWRQQEPPIAMVKCEWRDFTSAPVTIGSGWNVGVWGRHGMGVHNGGSGAVTAQGGYGFKDCPKQ
ncbi:hypothetical protein HYT00_02525 [Candidatus Giovannonibacteria bacterium]|nr:hypothetical protein [Candidatus Giovannonibacteria bacterium]